MFHWKRIKVVLLQAKTLIKSYCQIQGWKDFFHLREENFVAMKYSKIERIESLFPWTLINGHILQIS